MASARAAAEGGAGFGQVLLQGPAITAIGFALAAGILVIRLAMAARVERQPSPPERKGYSRPDPAPGAYGEKGYWRDGP